jgi:hypothetical protein
MDRERSNKVTPGSTLPPQSPQSIFGHGACWNQDLQPYCPACLYATGVIVELERTQDTPESGACPTCGRQYPGTFELAMLQQDRRLHPKNESRPAM